MRLVVARAAEFIAVSGGAFAKGGLGEELGDAGHDVLEVGQQGKHGRQFLPVLEPRRAVTGHVGQAQRRRLEFLVTTPRFTHRRVEQHAGGKFAALVGRKQRRQSRDGVVHTDLRLMPVGLVNCLENPVVVLNQGGNRVTSDRAYRVPAVVSEVMDNHVEIVEEERPEGIIQVDGKTVAVAQNKPRA